MKFPTNLEHGVTQKRLKEVYSYDPDTGLFERRRAPGVPVVVRRGNGYLGISLDGKHLAAHRMVWLYMTGECAPSEIDHINHVKTDNRWANLRLSSAHMNQANRLRLKKKVCKAKGVVLAPFKRYRARLCHLGKDHDAGYFDTEDEAAHAYNKMAIKYFGEFAVLNPIGQDKHQREKPDA